MTISDHIIINPGMPRGVENSVQCTMYIKLKLLKFNVARTKLNFIEPMKIQNTLYIIILYIIT